MSSVWRRRKRSLAYLFVCKAQLVLQDDAAIVQRLGLIGQRIEGIGEALGELEVRHTHAEGCRIDQDGEEEASLMGAADG